MIFGNTLKSFLFLIYFIVIDGFATELTDTSNSATKKVIQNTSVISKKYTQPKICLEPIVFATIAAAEGFAYFQASGISMPEEVIDEEEIRTSSSFMRFFCCTNKIKATIKQDQQK